MIISITVMKTKLIKKKPSTLINRGVAKKIVLHKVSDKFIEENRSKAYNYLFE